MRAGVRPECAHARQSAPGSRPCASECAQIDTIYPSKQRKGTSENQNYYILKEQTTDKNGCGNYFGVFGKFPVITMSAGSAPMQMGVRIGVRIQSAPMHAHWIANGIRSCASECPWSALRRLGCSRNCKSNVFNYHDYN